MLSLVFLFVILSPSASVVPTLICSTNCSFSGQINNVPTPRCNEIDRLTAEQRCRIEITIDYFSNAITGFMNPVLPPPITRPYFDVITSFSLADEESRITIQFTCASKDRCDSEFLAKVVQSDWLTPQTQARTLRTNLAESLFNASDLRPEAVCPASQPCSGDGFCSARYEVWDRDVSPRFTSACVNSTAKPSLEWTQLTTATNLVDVVSFTCNTPSCASEPLTKAIFQMIQADYKLPFDVPTSTTTAMPETTTTKPSAASLIHLNTIDKFMFVPIYLLSRCFFHC